MGEPLYSIIFKGQIQPGKSPDTVKENLSRYYKVTIEKAQSLFTGKTFVVKKGVTLDQAQALMLQFEQMGALCSLVKVEQPPMSFPIPDVQPQPQIKTQPQSSQLIPSSPVTSLPLTNIENKTEPPKIEIIPPTETQSKSQSSQPSLKKEEIPQLSDAVMYRVVFNGELAHGTTIADVKLYLLKNSQNPSRLIDQLLTGIPITLVESVDFVTAAQKYKDLLAVGAICRIDPIEYHIPRLNIPQAAPAPVKEDNNTVRCPRCSSNSVRKDERGFNWVAGSIVTVFTTPIGGYIAGKMSEGKKIYVCDNCGKKWDRQS